MELRGDRGMGVDGGYGNGREEEQDDDSGGGVVGAEPVSICVLLYRPARR